MSFAFLPYDLKVTSLRFRFVVQVERKYLQTSMARPGHIPVPVLHAQPNLPARPRQGAESVSTDWWEARRQARIQK